MYARLGISARGLYGLTLHQYYRYVRSYRQDALWVKCLALGIVYGEVMPIYGDIALTPAFRVMETLHVVCCVAAVYYHLVSNYFNPASLSAGHWSTRVSTQVLQLSRVEQKLKQRTATTFSLIRSFSFRPRLGVSMLLCQSFYTLRLYRLGPDYTSFRLVVVVVIAMVCEFGFVLALTIEGYLLSFDDFQHVIWLICLLAGFSVFIDICLMGTLVAALMKSKTGYNRMDSLIDVLIIYSINAGVLTSVFALLTFIFAIALPGNLIYVAFSIIGVKLYANSVLAVLNCRQSLCNRMLEGFELNTLETGRSRFLRDSQSTPMTRRPTPKLSDLVFVVTFGSQDLRGLTRESIEDTGRDSVVDRDVEEVEASDCYALYSAYLELMSFPDASPISHT
ncbi:hypothetical protein NUW54_g9776 [Trametes sanguinea]|uniref:Uncharacterized protein n=1 Tax=Trametes sanguinea TaxID=158606 RepID=A0ACC1P6A9_9APHY|nr:hypothetical protein NUW54_g9776 [Trametes sanguinea]